MPHSIDTSQAVVFRIAAELYAVSTSAAREVIPYAAPRRLPGAASHVLGVLNIRGDIIPISDVMLALGMQAVGDRRQIVVCEVNGSSVGIVVEAVESITRIDTQDIMRPETLSHPALTGVIKSGDELIVIMDVAEALHVPDASNDTVKELRQVTTELQHGDQEAA